MFLLDDMLEKIINRNIVHKLLLHLLSLLLPRVLNMLFDVEEVVNETYGIVDVPNVVGPLFLTLVCML